MTVPVVYILCQSIGQYMLHFTSYISEVWWHWPSTF